MGGTIPLGTSSKKLRNVKSYWELNPSMSYIIKLLKVIALHGVHKCFRETKNVVIPSIAKTQLEHIMQDIEN
jgi:hypothetical protein